MECNGLFMRDHSSGVEMDDGFAEYKSTYFIIRLLPFLQRFWPCKHVLAARIHHWTVEIMTSNLHVIKIRRISDHRTVTTATRHRSRFSTLYLRLRLLHICRC